ncbi:MULTISPECIES: methyltransferase domain-containing protein [unclassified Streptomyces]|uniref:methyltransferase domain-containing protein n=1 Tax=unclassified Streptomyces TaxID=2593676 RepID=UPI0026D174A2
MSTTALTSAVLPAGLIALPGVHGPRADTRFLARALADESLGPRTDALEIGTGTGALALRMAGSGARVTAVDVSWAAVATARLNALHRRCPCASCTETSRRAPRGAASTWSSPTRRTSPPRAPGCRPTGPSAPGTPASTGAGSSTGSARARRTCCAPAASC